MSVYRKTLFHPCKIPWLMVKLVLDLLQCHLGLLLLFTFFSPMLIVHGSLIINTWTVPSINSSLTHLVRHSSTGMVYVNGKNRLYTFEEDLRSPVAPLVTGPLDGHPECYDPTECAFPLISTDSHSKGLIIDYKSNTLISCTNLKWGTCVRRSFVNLGDTVTSKWFMVPPNLESSAALHIAPGPRPNEDILYVGATRTFNNLVDNSLPHVSGRNLTTFEIYLQTSLAESAMRFETPIKVTFKYSFHSGGFMYFLVVRNPDDETAVTHLIRSCLNDTCYKSYSEIPLVCQHHTEYTIAKNAHLAKPGRALRESLGLPDSDTHTSDILFISFGKKDSSNSVVCAYTMVSVRTMFTETIQRCFSGTGGVSRSYGFGSYECTKSVS